jgi:hypothetical protein
MEVSRQHLVEVLRRTGFPEVADDVRLLPDPVDIDVAARVLEPLGISKNELITRMGGSPSPGWAAAPHPWIPEEGDMSDERTTGILVGLDGSQGSVATLQKAISVEHDGHLVVRPESALECALRDPVLSGIAAIALAKSMHAEIVAVHLFESPLSCPGSWSGRRTDGRRWRSGEHRGVRV